MLENAEGRLYVGQTDDLIRRVAQHNDADAPTSKFTAKHGPRRLVWSEEHPDRSSAVRRERQIKRMKSARWIRENLLRG
ncbi:MAG: GIY-YIG nuclease family protein [Planctomycetota bacterium]